jgi:hypothetical protein
MPPVQDAAKSLGLTTRDFADDMASEVLSECDASEKLAKQKATAEALENALKEERARAEDLAARLSAAERRSEVATRLLNEERAKPPRVVTRPAARATNAGQVELELRIKSSCKPDCASANTK